MIVWCVIQIQTRVLRVGLWGFSGFLTKVTYYPHPTNLKLLNRTYRHLYPNTSLGCKEMRVSFPFTLIEIELKQAIELIFT